MATKFCMHLVIAVHIPQQALYREVLGFKTQERARSAKDKMEGHMQLRETNTKIGTHLELEET